MTKRLQIIPSSDAGRPLNKAQKRFNRLVDHIRSLRSELEQMGELDLALRRLGDQRIRPAEKKFLAADRTLVMALHYTKNFDSLSIRQAEKFDAIMVELLDHLLNTAFYQEDAELQQMLVRYYDDGRTYEEIQAEQAQLASEFFNQLFGADELDDPENPREETAAKQTEADTHFRAEQKASRKKAPAQLEREAKQAAAAAALKKTVKQIYLDLVRHFHPDKEQDEARRAAKTETMKQITAAYEADDHLQLLELQMTLLSDRDNVFAEFNDTQLNYFNDVLQRQVHELNEQIALAHPASNGNIYARFFAPSPQWMERNISQYLRELEKHQKQIVFTLKMIQTARGLRTFVDDYSLLQDDEQFF